MEFASGVLAPEQLTAASRQCSSALTRSAVDEFALGRGKQEAMTRLTAGLRGTEKSSNAAWRVFVDEDVRSAAIDMIVRMAERLADAPAVVREVERARARTSGLYLWQPASLSSGYAGLAVFYAYLSAALPMHGLEALARESMERAAGATADEPLRHPGLYSGSSGVAFALLCLAEIDDRYRPAAARAYEAAARQVLQSRRDWMHAPTALADERDFDVIGGAAGVLAALLAHPRPAAAVDEAIRALIADLVTFCRPARRPGFRSWRVSPRGPDAGRSGSADGWYDLGLAHGVLGGAVALSTAYGHGYRHDGLVAAIDNVCSWFADRCVHDDRGINWPAGVLASIDDDLVARHQLMPARPGWCYGAAGGARALWLSAAALQNGAFRQIALDAIKSAAQRSPATRRLYSPNLCHGLSGLLMTCLRFAQDVQDEALREAIPALTAEIVDSCNPGLPFFVIDRQSGGEEVEEPGFLTGTVGVGLALLAAVSPIEPKWDRALLLSG